MRLQNSTRKKVRRSAIPILCFFLILPARFTPAQEQYKSVEPADLLKTPQKYWARPILFKDRLIEPPTRVGVDIERKHYASFSTRDVGICYADEALLPEMAALAKDQDYLFSGTMFQYRGRYVPIIQSYTPAVDTQTLSADMKAVAAEVPDEFTNNAVRPMADLLAAVQRAHVAYAKEKNIPLCQLYDPTSEHYVKALDIARTAIYSSEQKNNTASAEILAGYLSTVLAKQCAPETNMPYVALPENQKSAQPADETKQVEGAPTLAPATTNVAPKKLSWSERRAQARAKKAEDLKTQQVQEKQKAAGEAARKESLRAAAEVVKKEQIAARPAVLPRAPPPAITNQPAKPATTTEPKAVATPPAAPPHPAETAVQKPVQKLSWFQRWKLEQQKKAAVKAERRRIEKEKKQAERQLDEIKKTEEKKRVEEKKVAPQPPPPAATPAPTIQPGDTGIYEPVDR